MWKGKDRILQQVHHKLKEPIQKNIKINIKKMPKFNNKYKENLLKIRKNR